MMEFIDKSKNRCLECCLTDEWSLSIFLPLSIVFFVFVCVYVWVFVVVAIGLSFVAIILTSVWFEPLVGFFAYLLLINGLSCGCGCDSSSKWQRYLKFGFLWAIHSVRCEVCRREHVLFFAFIVLFGGFSFHFHFEIKWRVFFLFLICNF